MNFAFESDCLLHLSEWPSFYMLFVLVCLLLDVFVLCLCDSGFLDALDVVVPCEDICEVWVDSGGVVAEHLISHPRDDLALCGSGVDPVPVSAPLLAWASRGGVSCLMFALFLVSIVIMALICVVVLLA